MAGALSTFEEIINAIKYLKDGSKDSTDVIRSASRAQAISNVSIATRARLNVCQFPLLVSSNLSVTTYRKVSDILEQLCAQYLKLAIVNSLEVINLGDGENKLTIVGKVHQNDNALATYSQKNAEEIIKSSMNSAFEDTKLEIKKAIPFLEMANFSEYDLKKANKELLKPYNENFNSGNLNNSNILKEDDAIDVKNDLETKYDKLISISKEMIRIRSRLIIIESLLKDNISDDEKDKLEVEKVELNEQYEALKVQQEELEKIIKRISDKVKIISDIEKTQADLAIRASKEARDRKNFETEKNDKEERANFRNKFGAVTDFDNALIKKNNQLEPSILSLSLKYHTKGGSFEETKLALAVKTISHLVNSDELCFYVNETLNKKRKVFRALQVLTGEKEFSLRFLLHLDEAKRDAKADSTTAKWYKHLKDRRTASWIRAFRHKDPYVPNATILMSQEDYETIKLMYKKDIVKDTKLAYQLTDLLFLMHLVIVNDINNELMIFNKDSRNWETYSLDRLQNEINTMNKMANNTMTLR